jgi:hypothetical protein
MSIVFIVELTSVHGSPFNFVDEIWLRRLNFEGYEVTVLLNYLDYKLLGTHPKNPNQTDYWKNSPYVGFCVQGIRFKFENNVGYPEIENGNFKLEVKY